MFSWFRSTNGDAQKKKQQHNDVLGEEVASSDEILQALQMKRMMQLRELQKLEKQAKSAMDGGNRAAAVMFLRQKSVIDTRIKQMDGQIHNMQSQAAAMETAAMSAQITRALQREANSMRTIVDTISVEDVEELTDDLHDLSTQSYEMGDALSRPIGEAFMPITVEDDIESQLAAWQQEGQPTVRVQQPAGTVQKDDDNFILAASMPSPFDTQPKWPTADRLQNKERE